MESKPLAKNVDGQGLVAGVPLLYELTDWALNEINSAAREMVREALEEAVIIARDAWRNVPDGSGDCSFRIMGVETSISRLKEKYK